MASYNGDERRGNEPSHAELMGQIQEILAKVEEDRHEAKRLLEIADELDRRTQQIAAVAKEHEQHDHEEHNALRQMMDRSLNQVLRRLEDVERGVHGLGTESAENVRVLAKLAPVVTSLDTKLRALGALLADAGGG